MRPTGGAADAGVGTHTAADEATVLARWAVAALELAPLTDLERTWLTGESARVAQELRDAGGPAGSGAAGPVLAHRDLHDGQILCAPGAARLLRLAWRTNSPYESLFRTIAEIVTRVGEASLRTDLS